jgi:tetraacyldisaccharide 4'-kinase
VKAAVPVLSVGNISAGGTGKTPLVAWLARLMVIHNMRPAILSRGYGRHRELGVDDENLMLSRLAEGVPVVVDPVRVRGAERAAREHDADVLILDDGFQHRRIQRDLDIVLIDALWPFGAEHLLPRGLLREPLSGLSRADVLLITRSSLVAPERLDEVKDRLRELAPRAVLASCRNVPSGLRTVGGPGEAGGSVSRLSQGRWGAFCGIGNPEAFRATLEGTGCRLAFFRLYSDHERYTQDQVRSIQERARRAGCGAIVTTEKDAVKIERLLPADADVPLYALQVEMKFTAGSAELTRAILRAIGKTP